MEKLTILTDAAKYDAACTSSGAQRGHRKGYIGNTSSSTAGCCHTFSGDGRCVTLLKVLMTNCCVYDCKYCVNRCSNDTRRAVFTPEELADLTIQFYRRNYIEGLFLSSGVLQSPDYTTERMIRCLDLLRNHYRFNGYIHAKAIPGTSPELVTQLGLLADRLSVNIELPSETGLKTLAPNKTRKAIFRPMGLITNTLQENKEELVKYRHAPQFAPAGQSTQMIIGATPDSDRHILSLTQALYDKYRLRRVFYSAYVPVVENTLLPSIDTKPPLLREHRLYQADWLLRFYGFRAEELLDEDNPNVNYNMLVTNWDGSNVEEILMPCMYEDIYRIYTGENLKTEGWKIPSEEYERIMTTYFPVSVGQLREHCEYDERSNSYEYEMIYASPYPPFGEVVDYTENADGTITLIVDGVWPDYNSDLAFRNTVVVQPFEDGTFRYLSNSIEQIELELPPIARKKG